MNYILIMSEGTTEKAFLDVLLEKKILGFPKEELLGEQIFHLRQIKGEALALIQMLPYQDCVTIYRIGDKLSDQLQIPKNILPEKINNIIDISTTPEFEVLFLINEDMYDEYLKEKSVLKPSEFYKRENSSYNKQSKFVKEYFSKMSRKEIIDLIKLYDKKHGKIDNEHNKFTLLKIINN